MRLLVVERYSRSLRASQQNVNGYKPTHIVARLIDTAGRNCMAASHTAAAMSSLTASIPLAVFSDTYKATHPLQYPDCNKMVAYGEFRCGYGRDAFDTRIVHYGIRHLVETYLLKRWTEADLAQAEAFYTTHCTSGTPLPWPKELFKKIVTDKRYGYFPIRVQALREGTCTHARVPAYQITAEGEFAPLCLFLETVLTHIWYPTTVATLSRRARSVIEDAFERAADGGAQHPLVASRLHDFGMRGCCTGEQAIIGGCAHLLSFDGSDTMPAAFHAQFHLNGGKPVASSIPATVRSAYCLSIQFEWWLYWDNVLCCMILECAVAALGSRPLSADHTPQLRRQRYNAGRVSCSTPPKWGKNGHVEYPSNGALC